jgi:hypothetical protein
VEQIPHGKSGLYFERPGLCFEIPGLRFERAGLLSRRNSKYCNAALAAEGMLRIVTGLPQSDFQGAKQWLVAE